MKDVREWADKQKLALDEEITRLTELGPMGNAYQDALPILLKAQREMVDNLIAFLDEPEKLEERIWHRGGQWNDEYFDQDGIPEWETNPRRKNA